MSELVANPLTHDIVMPRAATQLDHPRPSKDPPLPDFIFDAYPSPLSDSTISDTGGARAKAKRSFGACLTCRARKKRRPRKNGLDDEVQSMTLPLEPNVRSFNDALSLSSLVQNTRCSSTSNMVGTLAILVLLLGLAASGHLASDDRSGKG